MAAPEKVSLDLRRGGAGRQAEGRQLGHHGESDGREYAARVRGAHHRT
jgi:hypothetical protein